MLLPLPVVQELHASYFSNENQLLRFKRRLYVGSSGNIRTKALKLMHASGIRGHSEVLEPTRECNPFSYGLDLGNKLRL